MEMIGFYVVLGVAAAAFFWYASVRNRFERIRAKVTEADSGIDVVELRYLEQHRSTAPASPGPAGSRTKYGPRGYSLRVLLSAAPPFAVGKRKCYNLIRAFLHAGGASASP